MRSARIGGVTQSVAVIEVEGARQAEVAVVVAVPSEADFCDFGTGQHEEHVG